MATPKSMPFDGALWGLKGGARMTRKGWNAPGQWVMLVRDPPRFRIFRRAAAWYKPMRVYDQSIVADDVTPEPFFLRFDANGFATAWVPSTGDLLAEDWMEAP